MMKSHFPRLSSRLVGRSGAALAAVGVGGQVSAATWWGPVALPAQEAQGQFGFGYEGVLGTSLDVRLDIASRRDAAEAEGRILAEIDRLEKILSPYRVGSEFSRVRAGARIESAELAEILAAYDVWAARSGGALSKNLAEVIALWRQAEKDGCEPAVAALAAAYAAPGALNIDALGKSYVVDRLVGVGRQFAPSGLVDIGGDLRVWGERTWMVGVADPRAPEDNSAPLLSFPVRDAAVATSAGYARSYGIGARRFSHVIDPRSLRPMASEVSATVVARDCLTANAVATAAAVLGRDASREFTRRYALESLVLDGATARPTSTTLSSGGAAGAALQPMAAAAGDTGASAGAWPEGFQVSINVSLKAPSGGRYKRPYVAVWVESEDLKIVRTLAIWGDRDRYLPDLSHWWKAADGDEAIIRRVSRATRQAGNYTLAWNGLDDRNAPVPAGNYTIWVEVNREHGHHVIESAALACGTDSASAVLHSTAESAETTVKYGPVSK